MWKSTASRDRLDRWQGDHIELGVGATAEFAKAALHRDRRADFLSAFQAVVRGFVQLVDDQHRDLGYRLGQPHRHPELRSLQRRLWSFTRDPQAGLPAASLLAHTEWHPALLARVRDLLEDCETNCGITPTDTVGQRLSKKNLKAAPLSPPIDLASTSGKPIRADTVHQAKGESIGAVMYVASKDHAKELLSGTATEPGRIGYVAVSRAQRLFILAVPASNVAELKPLLEARGVQPLAGS